MARLSEELKTKVKDAIRSHLALNGARNWDSVLSKFPEVSAATFHRLVKDVREDIMMNAAQDSPEALRVAQQRIKAVEEHLPQVQEETARQIPCAPSPAIIASKRDRGAAYLKVLTVMENVLDDGEVLREWSITRLPEGGFKVKNPQFFVKAANMRMDVARAYLEALAQAYDLKQINEFYNLILDEVGKASPEVQHAILLRLKQANSIHAMTVDAEI